VVSNFARLNAGDYKSVVAQLAPDVHYVFAGDSALGGERLSREAVSVSSAPSFATAENLDSRWAQARGRNRMASWSHPGSIQ
jgi:hypothetical protein